MLLRYTYSAVIQVLMNPHTDTHMGKDCAKNWSAAYDGPTHLFDILHNLLNKLIKKIYFFQNFYQLIIVTNHNYSLKMTN